MLVGELEREINGEETRATRLGLNFGGGKEKAQKVELIRVTRSTRGQGKKREEEDRSREDGVIKGMIGASSSDNNNHHHHKRERERK